MPDKPTIQFKWSQTPDVGDYKAIYNDGRAAIILTATAAMHGKFWWWSAVIQHDHDDLQEFVEYRLTARTLKDAKRQAEAIVHRIIRAMQALHGSFDDA